MSKNKTETALSDEAESVDPREGVRSAVVQYTIELGKGEAMFDELVAQHLHRCPDCILSVLTDEEHTSKKLSILRDFYTKIYKVLPLPNDVSDNPSLEDIVTVMKDDGKYLAARLQFLFEEETWLKEAGIVSETIQKGCQQNLYDCDLIAPPWEFKYYLQTRLEEHRNGIKLAFESITSYPKTSSRWRTRMILRYLTEYVKRDSAGWAWFTQAVHTEGLDYPEIVHGAVNDIHLTLLSTQNKRAQAELIGIMSGL